MIQTTDKKAVAVIKLQLLFFAMLAAVFLRVILPISAVIVIELVLAAAFLFVLFVDVKRLFGRDFNAIAIFFVFLLAIIFASFATQLMPFQAISLRFELILAISVVVLVFFLVYSLFLSRNFLHGAIVSSDKDSAIVETEFDFLAGINAGKYRVKTTKHYPIGKKVKLKVGQGFFGRKPVGITE